MDIIVKKEQDNTPHCPVCDHHLDCHTGAGHNKLPRDGDVSVCINCVSVLVYIIDENGINLRFPTEEENAQFFDNPDIMKAREIVKLIKAKVDGSN